MTTIDPVPTEKKKCIACRNDIPLLGAVCGICKSPQAVEFCLICKQAMPLEATRCNACDAYQDWRRHFPFSQTVLVLLVALIAVISPAITAVSYLLNWNSHTRFKVAGASADGQFVYIKVWNTGRRPSVLLGYHLVLENLPLKQKSLDLRKADKAAGKNVIATGNPLLVGLTGEFDTESKPGHPEPHTKEQLENLLKNASDQPLTLTIDVEESDDAANRYYRRRTRRMFHTYPDTFAIGRLHDFIVSNTNVH